MTSVAASWLLLVEDDWPVDLKGRPYERGIGSWSVRRLNQAPV